MQQVEDVAFVNTEDDSTPFSFLKYIFWNSSIDIHTTTGRQIFKHEVAHIQEKHTHDKLFVNIVLIFCWCNPFFWLYRKELNMIHEFIADKKAVEDSDISAFAAMILQAAYPKHRFELANNFFYSPIKRRLLMLTKNKNPRVNYIGRIMVLPLAVLIFAAFTFKTKSNSPIYNGKKITVVIDAGHGGQDAGATSTDGILEKDLTLSIAKKIKELNSNDAIEVVLVRDGDVYMNPQQKVAFAKSKNADLVISLHVDNGPEEQANIKTGMSVFVAKNEFANAAESKVLASAIVNEFSSNYGLAVKPQPTQRQVGIWILQANTCPAVLIETGFLNNEKDLAYLQTSAAKETIAKNLLLAIEKYFISKPVVKNLSEESLSTKQQWETATSKPVNKADTTPQTKSITIQDTGGKTLMEIESRNPKLLFVLDGVVQGKDFDVNQIKPNDIAGIDVIKNEAAIAQYGQPAKEGVIIIKTKKYEAITANDNFDSENALYVVNGKIIGKGKEVKAQANKIAAEKVYVKWLKKPEAIAKYGKAGADGACEINYTNGEISSSSDNVQTNDIAASQQPILYLGATSGGKIQLDYLKSIKEIGMSTGYKLVSATMYFEGSGFDKNVVQLTLNSNSLSSAATYINRCKDGAKIVFDNVKVADKNGAVKTLTGYNPVFVALNNPANNNTEMVVAGRKAESIDLLTEKQKLQAKQQTETHYKEIAVIGKKIESPGLQQEKQNLMLEQQAQQDNRIFTMVEQAPQFTGGEPAWRNYLQKNLKAITPVDEGWKAGVYQVIVKFVVHTDGTVSDVTTEDYTGTKTALHCIDVIKNAPKWQPALQNGRKVNAYKKQPITFVIEE